MANDVDRLERIAKLVALSLPDNYRFAMVMFGIGELAGTAHFGGDCPRELAIAAISKLLKELERAENAGEPDPWES
jgi:hypothetical protein